MDNEAQDIAVGMDIQNYQCKTAGTLSILCCNRQYKKSQDIPVYNKKLLFKWLNRRSQRRSYTWKTLNEGLLRTFPLLEPSIKVSLFYR